MGPHPDGRTPSHHEWLKKNRKRHDFLNSLLIVELCLGKEPSLRRSPEVVYGF